MDLQAKLALKEIKVAYSNTSTLACADESCSSTVETRMGPQTKRLKFWVKLDRGTLTQELTMLTATGQVDSGKVAVRNECKTASAHDVFIGSRPARQGQRSQHGIVPAL
jgi:hypothetical protein